MATKKPELLTVPNLECLAEVVGVHRRTLCDYLQQGCPTIKAKAGGYLISPTLWWYSRMMMRRQVTEFLKTTRIPEMLEETIQQILDDHAKSWPMLITKEFGK